MKNNFHFKKILILGEKQKLKNLLDCHSAEIKINKPQDMSGNTPLHLAILGNHLSTVQILMAKYGNKIDGNLVNNDGHNALDLAITGKNSNVISTLLEYYVPKLSTLSLGKYLVFELAARCQIINLMTTPL